MKTLGVLGVATASMLVLGCQVPVVEQVTIHSTPSVCFSNAQSEPRFCANKGQSNDYTILMGSSCMPPEFSPEWGVTYVVTLKKTMTPSEAGGCGYDLELLSIDGEMPDALGTRYEYGLNASTLGGVTIKRIETDPNWLELQGYKEPVYCTDAVCQDLQVGTTYWISESTVFELVEIEGSRTIGLVQL